MNMSKIVTPPLRRTARFPVARLSRLAALVYLAWGGMHAAHAGTIDFGNGIEGLWSLTASYTSGWRMKNPDPDLIGIGNGGRASASTQSTDNNFGKGNNFTDLLRVVGDIDVHKGSTGVVLRAKVWDDLRYSRGSVSFGAPSNGFTPYTKLDDSHFDTNLSKFKGFELLDAYAYSSFDLGQTAQLKVRVGQHAVNFGESLFIPGVNQYQVLDVTALRQPGTLLKEAILPVPQISANLGLGGGKSIEAFYQFQWRRSAIDGCGTYWSPATALNCTPGSILVDGNGTSPSQQAWGGIPNYQFSRLPDKTPSNSGQFGIAFKDMVESIDTEFGAYFVNYAPKVPNLSAVRRAAGQPDAIQHPAGSVYGLPPAITGLMAQNASIYWDYSANNIKVLGLSASTVLGGWSTSAELSFTKGFPVQLNPVDSFLGLALDSGPAAGVFGGTAAKDMPGYERKNKLQIQLSTTKVFSHVLGAASASFVAEAAYQRWNGIGDPYTGLRYGRGFEFGAAQHASFGGACPAAATNAGNCTQDGYFTSNAWGVRAMIELEYPNLIPNVVVKPRLFISEDVKGWSADGVFSQGRYAITPGVKFEVNKKYTLDLSYTHFNPNARFDSFHDRDFVAAVLTASF